MSARHGEQVAHGHSLQIFALFSRQLVGEELHHRVVKVELPFVDGKSHGDGGECLADREHGMRRFGRLAVKPSLQYHLPVFQYHDAVQGDGVWCDRTCLCGMDERIDSRHHFGRGIGSWQVDDRFLLLAA